MSNENYNVTDVLSLAQRIAEEFAEIPSVVAVALSGSQATQIADSASDLDIYVYLDEEIPIQKRATIACKFADRIEIDNRFWEPGDEWVDRDSKRGVDIMYRTPTWIENQLNQVLIEYQASVGYSTCFWFNVQRSQCLYDRNGWFKQLQQKASQPYPERLQRAIIAKNYPVLRQNLSSYVHQLELAIKRQDLISVNHRIAALLASYFDIIFAVNAIPHPGEKRLLQFAKLLCPKLPDQIDADVNSLLVAGETNNLRILECINRLVDNLDKLLVTQGLNL